MPDLISEYSFREWFIDQNASFARNFECPFATILHPFGNCFTFNMMNFEDVFNTEEYEKKFYFEFLLNFAILILLISESPIILPIKKT